MIKALSEKAAKEKTQLSQKIDFDIQDLNNKLKEKNSMVNKILFIESNIFKGGKYT